MTVEIFIVVSLVALWLLVTVGAFLILGLARQVGMLAATLDERSLPERSDASPTGLPTGALAPAFTLLDTAGAPVSLSDYQGRCLLLVFAGAACRACSGLLPHLNALAREAGDSVSTLLILNSSRVEAERWITAHQVLSRVALQEDLAVSNVYHALVTPFGFAINETGRVIAGNVLHDLADLTELVRTFDRHMAMAS